MFSKEVDMFLSSNHVFNAAQASNNVYDQLIPIQPNIWTALVSLLCHQQIV